MRAPSQVKRIMAKPRMIRAARAERALARVMSSRRLMPGSCSCASVQVETMETSQTADNFTRRRGGAEKQRSCNNHLRVSASPRATFSTVNSVRLRVCRGTALSSPFQVGTWVGLLPEGVELTEEFAALFVDGFGNHDGDFGV